MRPTLDLSVVIPTYNGRHLLEDCLASLEEAWPSSLAIEVIVVDDGSCDDTLAWVHARHPRVRVLGRSQNGGFVAAVNAGLDAARAPFVQVLNNDATVRPGWAEAALVPFQDPAVGAVSPLVLLQSDPSRVDSAGDRLSAVGWPCKRGHGELATRWRQRLPDEVFAASGSCAIYRAAALQTIGPFDSIYGSYFEDVDLSFRLRWAGYRCVFQPTSVVHHAVSSSYDHRQASLHRRLSRNAEILYWSNMPAGPLLATLPLRLVFQVAQAGWKLSRGQLVPYLLGKWDACWLAAPIAQRRRQRAALRAAAIGPPRFPLTLAFLGDIRNHLKRAWASPAYRPTAQVPSSL